METLQFLPFAGQRFYILCHYRQERKDLLRGHKSSVRRLRLLLVQAVFVIALLRLGFLGGFRFGGGRSGFLCGNNLHLYAGIGLYLNRGLCIFLFGTGRADHIGRHRAPGHYDRQQERYHPPRKRGPVSSFIFHKRLHTPSPSRQIPAGSEAADISNADIRRISSSLGGLRGKGYYRAGI